MSAPDKGTVLALAERVEALTGPSRDVDAGIAPLQGLCVQDHGHPLGLCCYDSNHRSVVLPRYTASLDAAMTLVPEDVALLDLELSWEPAEPGVHPAAAVRFYPTGKRGKDWHAFTVSAATPALALCAAALRARGAL